MGGSVLAIFKGQVLDLFVHDHRHVGVCWFFYRYAYAIDHACNETVTHTHMGQKRACNDILDELMYYPRVRGDSDDTAAYTHTPRNDAREGGRKLRSLPYATEQPRGQPWHAPQRSGLPT